MDLYREEILEHWRNPQNFGELGDFDLVIDQINPLCGDRVRFFFKFNKAKNGKIIKEVSFTGNGCAISIASASILSEVVKGMKVEMLEKITGVDILKMFGGRKGFPSARLRCVFLPLEALKRIKV